MSARVLSNILNEVRKRDKMRGFPQQFSHAPKISHVAYLALATGLM